ncbi:hypothetical protein BU14_2199s0001 [Porphyra umbilicalis]|uniref:Uncharacterized protein n=1 Tax=Porphyra umbilicalis TaxID=2786 RepID=A0A1X6NJP5_PORUM|nr:hypothetical protein BU14_2199s0001 [Porphyra umbilicalis]|eukprot:OSX68825.1 hypothetical protein BU14_2199s0001 [Porphyra umbilicalis]
MGTLNPSTPAPRAPGSAGPPSCKPWRRSRRRGRHGCKTPHLSTRAKRQGTVADRNQSACPAPMGGGSHGRRQRASSTRKPRRGSNTHGPLRQRRRGARAPRRSAKQVHRRRPHGRQGAVVESTRPPTLRRGAARDADGVGRLGGARHTKWSARDGAAGARTGRRRAPRATKQTKGTRGRPEAKTQPTGSPALRPRRRSNPVRQEPRPRPATVPPPHC